MSSISLSVIKIWPWTTAQSNKNGPFISAANDCYQKVIPSSRYLHSYYWRAYKRNSITFQTFLQQSPLLLVSSIPAFYPKWTPLTSVSWEHGFVNIISIYNVTSLCVSVCLFMAKHYQSNISIISHPGWWRWGDSRCGRDSLRRRSTPGQQVLTEARL